MKTESITFRTTKETANGIDTLRKLVLVTNHLNIPKRQSRNQWIETAINEKIERDKNKLQYVARAMNEITSPSHDEEYREYLKSKPVDVAAIVAAHKPKEKRKLITNFGKSK